MSPSLALLAALALGAAAPPQTHSNPKPTLPPLEQGDDGSRAHRSPVPSQPQATQLTIRAPLPDQHEVTARVLGVQPDALVLDIGGAALPVLVDSQTRLRPHAGAPAAQGELGQLFRAGQEVTARFKQQGLSNVATEIHGE